MEIYKDISDSGGIVYNDGKSYATPMWTQEDIYEEKIFTNKISKINNRDYFNYFLVYRTASGFRSK